eukprot:CAMPEP_0171202934 /NCGR_PEP_ID=MMETSP0790-20130122/25260_1 /TAXON_ID=2925 /ORGANISM="Alexandrium catenella, Strain OF101" /LENGTH=892 /DNA_ID=CAMNT_0011668377 /DNA_START=56 /DNA_END=2734 /DNA_ORIENTATION=+
MTVSAAVWEVVGGARNGGIVVREEKDRSSQEAQVRLMAGALVRVLELDNAAGRLHYELISGSGPHAGWVTMKSQGKDLLTPWQGPLGGAEKTEDMPILRQELPQVSHVYRQQEKNVASLGGSVSYTNWQAKGKVTLNSKKVQKPADQEEGLVLCPECSLPVGDFAYRSDESCRLLHAECQAQLMLECASREEKTRQRRDAERKRSRRDENGIGWNLQQVPRNLACAKKMGFAMAPNGMYTLTFDEESNMARVAPTVNPAAALNMEYLALALQVRICDGREPMFSLDPKEASLDRAQSLWQVKRFEPAWLAGTSLGEAMFQADVHLKELSMGEYVQPVVGMKSCFDFSEEEGKEVEWNAREWFVVRRAEVHLSEENSLIPRVNMGVEAREQIAGASGLEDALLTSRDHPLVKYAEAFEHSFDLIAERKSVIYHLRELAKASVLAKFLVDNEVLIEDPWFSFDVKADEKCRLEIPQLWNERCHSQIEVRDGKIVDADQGINVKKHGLYGGVQMGLAGAMVPGTALRARGPPLTIAAGTLSRAPTASGLLGSGQEGFSYGAAIAGVPTVGPRGVDLNLGGFDLSEAKRSAPGALAFATGSAFFRNLDGSAKVFGEEDLSLFKGLFNPALSDRRSEGEHFMPPDCTPEYLEKLRALVAEEAAVREQQKAHFLSANFQRDAPGLLFPSSWVPTAGISNGQAARELYERADYSARMERMLKTMTPVFSKVAEEGTKYRIYELGSLEVRTMQPHDGKEKIGAVFSSRAPSARAPAGAAASKDADSIVRATQFVESSQQIRDSKYVPSDIRFYVVFETSAGDCFVTEKQGDATTWLQNPEDIEARNSFAKMTRSVECSDLGLTVLDAKRFQQAEIGRFDASAAEGAARYAEEAFALALTA